MYWPDVITIQSNAQAQQIEFAQGLRVVKVTTGATD